MTVGKMLSWGADELKKSAGKSDLPQLDAVALLSCALKKSKEYIYTYPEKKLSAKQAEKFRSFILRRRKHEPVAYIMGHKEFYGLNFLVTPAVLIPRPETETLIEAVKETIGARDSNGQIIDIGTGSGAIAVTLKKLLPKTQVYTSDISSAALKLAKKNANRLHTKIIFKKGDLLAPFESLLDVRRPIVLTANLPYLSKAEWEKTRPDVKKYEPRGALVGGERGWEIYEKLFRQIASTVPSLCKREGGRDFKKIPLHPPLRKGEIILFIEFGYNQKSAIEKLAQKILKPQKIEFLKDPAGKWRVAKIIM